MTITTPLMKRNFVSRSTSTLHKTFSPGKSFFSTSGSQRSGKLFARGTEKLVEVSSCCDVIVMPRDPGQGLEKGGEAAPPGDAPLAGPLGVDGQAPRQSTVIVSARPV
ncbi:hypothetical protein [Massilia sp. DWR3-1-1]|uniref:hypothetical protein n=1 Tax=Massilia sp. DWR3-1-1 TaxID=2804559 RepID=UPI003CF03707